MRSRLFCTLILTVTASFGSRVAASPESVASPWADETYPYRVSIQLDKEVSGSVQLDLRIDDLIEQLRTVSVDVADLDTLAFENAVLVDPATGKAVGGFKIDPVRRVDIAPWPTAGERGGAWSSFGGPPGQPATIEDGGETFDGMWIESDKIINRGWIHKLKLKPEALYHLQYRVYSEPIDNNISVSIMDPEKRLFVDEHHSYYPTLTPKATWTTRRVLVNPAKSDVELRIGTAFTGRCGVGDLTLDYVRMRLFADLPTATDRLALYALMRAGHRLPVPTEAMLDLPRNARRVGVKSLTAEAADLNPDAVMVEDAGVKAWTVASDLPLKTDVLPRTMPASSSGAGAGAAIQQTLVRGMASTVLVAVRTDTPEAVFESVATDLPVGFRVERLAEIPVYDGPTPGGRLIETRLDALTGLNFDLAPPSSSGIHLLAITLSANGDTPTGHHAGHLDIQLASPKSASLRLPIEVAVAPITIKPFEHFGTMFGGQHFLVRYSGGSFTEPSTTVAEFHGYDTEGIATLKAASLTSPDSNDQRFNPVRDLARKYYHRMLDFYVSPQSLTLYSGYTYRVEDQGEGKAPKLIDWDFTQYNQAIDEMVIGREVPYLAIGHTNGHLMDHLRLANGATYTLSETEGKNGWHQLPKDEYLKLIGDFYEQQAKNLADKGLLDGAMVIVDESDPSTYELMRDYILEVKSRPHGKRIKFTHTTYKPSSYTREDENGQLMLNGVLDIPMPDNDDHFNNFEPAYNARMTDIDEQWVYYVESDHLNLNNAGMSTIITPLKLGHFGAEGWYDWASFIWSMPYPVTDVMGPKFPSGPVINPWVNPFYHHGSGVLSFFYPPVPAGPSAEPVDRIIPSYRLALMRDGIQMRALLEVLEAGEDDAGRALDVDQTKVAAARKHLEKLWADNPVQWYLGYHDYREAQRLLHEAAAGVE